MSCTVFDNNVEERRVEPGLHLDARNNFGDIYTVNNYLFDKCFPHHPYFGESGTGVVSVMEDPEYMDRGDAMQMDALIDELYKICHVLQLDPDNLDLTRFDCPCFRYRQYSITYDGKYLNEHKCPCGKERYKHTCECGARAHAYELCFCEKSLRRHAFFDSHVRDEIDERNRQDVCTVCGVKKENKIRIAIGCFDDACECGDMYPSKYATYDPSDPSSVPENIFPEIEEELFYGPFSSTNDPS